jgi:hypothetical protein
MVSLPIGTTRTTDGRSKWEKQMPIEFSASRVLKNDKIFNYNRYGSLTMFPIRTQCEIILMLETLQNFEPMYMSSHD